MSIVDDIIAMWYISNILQTCLWQSVVSVVVSEMENQSNN